jgi:hypothetical protein
MLSIGATSGTLLNYEVLRLRSGEYYTFLRGSCTTAACIRKQAVAQGVVLCMVVIDCTTACGNLEGFDTFHAITCLRMRVCVVYVDSCAISVGAIKIGMASTSSNED